METNYKVPVIFYSEMTPNPSVMKFVASRVLIEAGASAEYRDAKSTSGSPLAARLFEFHFVKGVFIVGNFISITKSDSVQWEDINADLRDFLKQYVSSGKPIITELPKQEVHTDSSFEEKKTVNTQHTAPSTESENKIVEVLEEYIRPAVEQDGGMITFKSFRDGVVTVQMRGACSGCPSSTLTLKAGIETLLKRMVPEVKEVVAESV
jgi:NFU1 iron-sulfur cluster scaffold homolog, mitochondrial